MQLCTYKHKCSVYNIYLTFLVIFVICFFSYLSKGIIEKLEVVNKKWVRVRLSPGNSVEGSVSHFLYYYLI